MWDFCVEVHTPIRAIEQMFSLFCFVLFWGCFVCLILSVQDRVSLCSPGWPRIHDPPVSARCWDYKCASPSPATASFLILAYLTSKEVFSMYIFKCYIDVLTVLWNVFIFLHDEVKDFLTIIIFTIAIAVVLKYIYWC
jgi:hypothetical protein